MEKIIQVTFAFSESGFCYDVFRIKGGGRLCRMEEKIDGCNVPVWFTYPGEPDSPVRTEFEIQIVKGETIIATEQNKKLGEEGNWSGYYAADKKFPFSWEEDRNDLTAEEVKTCKLIYTK